MTSILQSARDEKFGRNSLFGLGGQSWRSIYGLGGQYMALGWPWDDLGGRPQMTSILVSARDEKFG